MYAVLNKTKNDVRLTSEQSIRFIAGDYGYEVKKLGYSGLIRLMPEDDREAIGVLTVDKLGFNKQIETLIEFGIERNEAGDLVYDAGKIKLIPETTPIVDLTRPLQMLKDRIEAKAEEVEFGGVRFNHEGVDYLVATDRDSQRKLSGSVQMVPLGGWGTEDYWTCRNMKTDEKIRLLLSTEGITTLGLAVGAHIKYNHGVIQFHKDEILKLKTLKAVLDYDLETGWSTPLEA
jgi:hypothetical protein